VKTRPLIDALILLVLFLSLAAMMDLTRQRALPSWTVGFPIFALAVAYGLGRTTGSSTAPERRVRVIGIAIAGILAIVAMFVRRVLMH
jgi:hypothetical protein